MIPTKLSIQNKSGFVFILSIALAVLINVHPCLARDYYVSSSTGDDRNDGRSEQTALKTLDELSAIPFLPGDTILFKRGPALRKNPSDSTLTEQEKSRR